MLTMLSIGQVSARSGVATSALRFYEAQGLISSTRLAGKQRRFPSEVLRRVAFVVAAQRVGLRLADIKAALDTLPANRTPTKADWERLSRGWRPLLDARIVELERLRDQLSSCIGCGCLSLRACGLFNAADRMASEGAGARRLVVEPARRTAATPENPV